MTDSMIAERIRRIAKSILADEAAPAAPAPEAAPQEAPKQQAPAQEPQEEAVDPGKGDLGAQLKEMLDKMVYQVGDYVSIKAEGASNDGFVTAVIKFDIKIRPQIGLSEIDSVSRVISDASKYLDDCMDKIEQWGTDNGVEINFKD